MSKIYQKMYLTKKSRSEGVLGGFTLIELLVVVLIIGVLAAIALPQYRASVEKARAAEGLLLLRRVYEADKLYKLANGEYASSLELLDVELPEDARYTVTVTSPQEGYGGIWLNVKSGQPSGVNWEMKLLNHHIYCKARSSDSLGKRICATYGPLETEHSGTAYYKAAEYH